ncbi:hypothetical protein ASPWEDRAFT_32882 [Aspergillus wentii DTO 134E9]|uniref:Uncharacterized protein n=1 Tax=Aspergillus wentii DTO 134E9 TaxID=1073089 RepID=A0A1L9R738_ASPWE|nr:uncharacterized protein ASPWEDRAFT_32882 [Aspergillus wentii DTO 134E9]OJJ30726.1 hypothetical protein ASPWEDRAFT_32882 [Aspergillus wentii DTO 134E9]
MYQVRGGEKENKAVSDILDKDSTSSTSSTSMYGHTTRQSTSTAIRQVNTVDMAELECHKCPKLGVDSVVLLNHRRPHPSEQLMSHNTTHRLEYAQSPLSKKNGEYIQLMRINCRIAPHPYTAKQVFVSNANNSPERIRWRRASSRDGPDRDDTRRVEGRNWSNTGSFEEIKVEAESSQAID